MIDATPLLRAYAQWRSRVLAREDAAAAQRRQLQYLVSRAAMTRFGRAHGFARIHSVAEFQARVRLRSYEDFWREFFAPAFPHVSGVTWPGRVPYFALSSGTSSGSTKYIPVTRAMLRASRRAALDVLVHHVTNQPRSRVLAGKSFLLGGSTDLRREAPGIRSGDLSGIAAAEVPSWARPYYYPPPALALLADWDRKIDRLARHSPAEPIRAISGTPSWLLLFFERLAATRPDLPARLASFYPDLELLVHGGVNFSPYRSQFDAWLAGGRAELREVYPASEGFIAIADRGPGEGMRLILDHGLFYEFIPTSELDSPAPTRHWIGDVETGVDYALAISSCAGLWCYLIGDVVRLIDRAPPRLLVVGRTAHFLSAFGEHVSGGEIERAVVAAAASIGRAVAEFAAGAEMPGARGRHVLVIEFRGPHPDQTALDAFAQTLDQRLSAANEDYRAHRLGGQLLAARVVAAPTDAFAEWMRGRGRLGGQNKVPRVITDPALLGSLLRQARA